MRPGEGWLPLRGRWLRYGAAGVAALGIAAALLFTDFSRVVVAGCAAVALFALAEGKGGFAGGRPRGWP